MVLHLFYFYLHGHISSHTIQICCTYYIQAVSFSMLAWLPLDCLGSVCIWVLPILVPSLCLLYIYILFASTKQFPCPFIVPQVSGQAIAGDISHCGSPLSYLRFRSKLIGEYHPCLSSFFIIYFFYCKYVFSLSSD